MVPNKMLTDRKIRTGIAILGNRLDGPFNQFINELRLEFIREGRLVSFISVDAPYHKSTAIQYYNKQKIS